MTFSLAAPTSDAGSPWFQTPPLTFARPITGADRTYQRIAEVPPFTIPYAGVWEISYDVRTAIGQPSTGTTVTQLFMTTAVFVAVAGSATPNRIVGTEAICGKYFNPDEYSQQNISRTFRYRFAANDQVTLWACRIGQRGDTQVVSNDDGRTALTAGWVNSEF